MATFRGDDADLIRSADQETVATIEQPTRNQNRGRLPQPERRENPKGDSKDATRRQERNSRTTSGGSPRSILKNARSSHAEEYDGISSLRAGLEALSVEGTDGICKNPIDPSLEDESAYDWTQNLDRYSGADVYHDKIERNVENLFGEKRGGYDRVVIDVNEKPDQQLREKDRLYHRACKTFLEDASEETKKTLYKKLTDKTTDKVARLITQRSEKERFAVLEFDANPLHYEVNVELWSAKMPGGIDVMQGHDYIIGKVLKALYDRWHYKFRVVQVNQVKRQLLQRAIDEVELRVQRLFHQITLQMMLRESNSNRPVTRQQQQRERELDRKIEALEYDKGRYGIMRKALKTENEMMNSPKVREEEERLERDRLMDEKLLGTEQLKTVARRATCDVPEFGDLDYYEDKNMKMRNTLLMNFTKIRGKESEEEISNYLKTCHMLINRQLTPRGAFCVLSDFAQPGSSIYKLVNLHKRFTEDRGVDVEKKFRDCWSYIQALADTPKNDASVVSEIVKYMLNTPDQANQLHKWISDITYSIYDLYRGKSPEKLDIYTMDTLNTIMDVIISMWWSREKTMLMETFREWKRREKPKDVLALQSTWAKAIKSKFEELRVHKASTPEFKGEDWWLTLAETEYNKRRRVRSSSPRRPNSPRFETRRSSNQGYTSTHRDHSRSYGQVKLTTARDSDNRSTISQGRGGEKYCFRCGHPDHYATSCDMYKERRETICPRCPEKLKLRHTAAECRGTYKNKNMKAFKTLAIDALDGMGDEDAMQREALDRIGLWTRDREGAIDKEDGELDPTGRELGDDEDGDPMPPDEF